MKVVCLTRSVGICRFFGVLIVHTEAGPLQPVADPGLAVELLALTMEMAGNLGSTTESTRMFSDHRVIQYQEVGSLTKPPVGGLALHRLQVYHAHCGRSMSCIASFQPKPKQQAGGLRWFALGCNAASLNSSQLCWYERVHVAVWASGFTCLWSRKHTSWEEKDQGGVLIPCRWPEEQKNLCWALLRDWFR